MLQMLCSLVIAACLRVLCSHLGQCHSFINCSEELPKCVRICRVSRSARAGAALAPQRMRGSQDSHTQARTFALEVVQYELHLTALQGTDLGLPEEAIAFGPAGPPDADLKTQGWAGVQQRQRCGQIQAPPAQLPHKVHRLRQLAPGPRRRDGAGPSLARRVHACAAKSYVERSSGGAAGREASQRGEWYQNSKLKATSTLGRQSK